MSAAVTLCPTPTTFKHEINFETVEVEVEQNLEIKGTKFFYPHPQKKK
jgi:hypothetical protein